MSSKSALCTGCSPRDCCGCCTGPGHEPHLTIVDPLAGAQLQPGAAPQGADPTGTPVREDVVRANLALGGVGSVIDARIQQGFSGIRRYGPPFPTGSTG